MDICFFPAGDENTASSRLRVYTLIDAFKSLGIEATASFDDSARFFIFQKKLNIEAIALAKKLKSEGKIVIYDVDDMPPGLDYWAPDPLFKEMLEIAMLIITDTSGHKSHLLQFYEVSTPIAVIPDTIDYFPQKWHAPATLDDSPIRVLWFGSVSNIALFEKYVDKLQSIASIKIVAAINPNFIGEYYERYPFMEFQPWSLNKFPDILRGCHLTLLMHDGSEVDRQKSNNKMICSINLGVPAIVSNTPDYAETAIKCGIDSSIFKDTDDVERCILELFTKESRLNYLNSAQNKVWQYYAPVAKARQLQNLLICSFPLNSH